jgi:hypothetical protein
MDVSKLTLGEVSEIEERSGQSINAMGDPNAPKGKLMAAMAYVMKRRSNPKYRFEDALNLPMEELDGMFAPDLKSE